MKKLLVITLTIFSIGLAALAPTYMQRSDVVTAHNIDEVEADAKTSVPENARYEMVKSSFMNATLRLDKYTGRVFQLVLSADRKHHWAEVEVEDLPKGIYERAIYQIYSFVDDNSSQTFLLNTQTKQTWMAQLDKDKKTFTFLKSALDVPNL